MAYFSPSLQSITSQDMYSIFEKSVIEQKWIRDINYLWVFQRHCLKRRNTKALSLATCKFHHCTKQRHFEKERARQLYPKNKAPTISKEEGSSISCQKKTVNYIFHYSLEQDPKKHKLSKNSKPRQPAVKNHCTKHKEKEKKAPV